MLRQSAVVKSGDDAQLRPLGQLLVDDLLRIIEAAAALRLAAEALVRGFGRAGALACGLAHFLFSDPIADADDHARYITLMRSVRKSKASAALVASYDESRRHADQHDVREHLGREWQELRGKRCMEAQRNDQPVHREIS